MTSFDLVYAYNSLIRVGATRNSILAPRLGEASTFDFLSTSQFSIKPILNLYSSPHVRLHSSVVAGADLMGDREGHGYFRVPRVVRGLDGTHVVSVHCGSNFTLAVDRNGATYR